MFVRLDIRKKSRPQGKVSIQFQSVLLFSINNGYCVSILWAFHAWLSVKRPMLERKVTLYVQKYGYLLLFQLREGEHLQKHNWITHTD